MFVIDNLALMPVRGVVWIARKVIEAAEQELAAEEEAIKREIHVLYRMLETGQVTEAMFDEKETALLDRLDQIEALRNGGMEG